MVASRIRCIVVEVPAVSDNIQQRRRSPARELLPWADPYIAGLIRKLQDEVREERAALRQGALQEISVRHLVRGNSVTAEAPPPLSSSPIEFEVPADEDWPLLRDMPADGAGR